MAMKLAMKISKPNNTNGFAVFSIGFDSRTGHHDTQIRTLHIVRNVFALTERIPLE